MKDFSADTGLRIWPLQRLISSGRWRIEAMHARDEACLLWFSKGQGRITIQGNTRGFTSNNAIFIPSGRAFSFQPTGMVYGCAVFFGDGLGLHLPPDPTHLRVNEAHAQHEISTLIQAVQRELEEDGAFRHEAARCHAAILSIWLSRQSARAEPPAPRPDAARGLVARYTDLLERNYRSGMAVQDFALALNVTPTHLTRCCKLACGRSASTLLRDRRLFEARKLLLDTKYPVKVISSSLGYTSPAYFTRSFQHALGKSPSDYRRQ